MPTLEYNRTCDDSLAIGALRLKRFVEKGGFALFFFFSY